jgi:mitogen-activated protein kinase 1/3
VIGTPDENEDLSFIKHEEAKKYLKCFKACPKSDLGEMYPAVDKGGIRLLEKMIEFNPTKRISAEDALKDEYFDEIRLDNQEKFEPLIIDLSFIDRFHEGELTMDQLKQMVTDLI